MTLLLEDPIVVTDTTTDDDNTLAHYYHKTQFDAKLFDEIPMVALCGFVKAGDLKDIIGRPVCLECQDIMDNIVGSNLPPGDRG